MKTTEQIKQHITDKINFWRQEERDHKSSHPHLHHLWRRDQARWQTLQAVLNWIEK